MYGKEITGTLAELENKEVLAIIEKLKTKGEKTLYGNILNELPYTDRTARDIIKRLKRQGIIDHDDNDQYYIV